MVVIAVLDELQSFAAWLLETYTGERLVLDFRAKLFRHIQRLSLSYHDTQGTADSMYRLQYDAQSIQNISVNGVMPFVSSILTLLAMIYVILRIDWMLAVVAVAAIPLLYLTTRSSVGQLRESWKQVRELESSALAVLQEVLASIRVVKAFVREDHEQQRFVDRSRTRLGELMRVIVLQMKFDLTIAVLIAVTSAATLSLGILHVRAGTLSLGNLLLVVGYLAQLYAPLRTMSRKSSQMQSALAGAERAARRARRGAGCGGASDGAAARAGGRRDRIPQRELRVHRRCARAARRLAADPRRDQRRHRRADRRRQDDAAVADDALLRPDGGRDPARRHRSARHRAEGPAQPVRHRPPGRRAVFHQRGGQHPVREAGRHPAGGRACRPRRQRARFHRHAAAGVPDGRRRTRHAPLRRRAAAHRAGARVSEGRARAAARRADELGGRQDRVGDHGGARPPDGGADDVSHRPSPEHAGELRRADYGRSRCGCFLSERALDPDEFGADKISSETVTPSER